MNNPTTQTYTSLSIAFDFFNTELFGGALFLIVENITTFPKTLIEIPTTPQKAVNRNR
jgi:hypothetical protein